MNKKEIKEKGIRSEELSTLINVTEKAIENLKKKIKSSNCTDTRFYKDNMYWLCLSDHSDGSGNNIDLVRYKGNEVLCNTILNVLEGQLEDFYKELESL